MRGADAGAEERRERAGLGQPERGEVDEAGQHSRHRRQLCRHVLPPLRRQEIGAAFEREMRPVLDQRLETDRPGGVAEPELDRRHRPESPRRPIGRAVAAGAAAIERRRNRAGAIGVGERRLPRPVETDAAAQVVVARNGGAGRQAHRGRERERGQRGGSGGVPGHGPEIPRHTSSPIPDGRAVRPLRERHPRDVSRRPGARRREAEGGVFRAKREARGRSPAPPPGETDPCPTALPTYAFPASAGR